MDRIGTLVIRVYTSQAQLPVENASVTVTTASEDSPRLLHFEKTDSSGKIKIINLDSPPIAESQNSQYEGIPFSSYYVKVDHPQFQSVIVKPVQVFSERETILDVELIPLSENESQKDNIRVITVTPQDL